MDWFWAPKTFFAGQLADNPQLAALSCKYRNSVWAALGKFTKMTGGFKPGKQQDGSVELVKQVTGKVQEFENVPAAGFKLVPAKVVDNFWVTHSDLHDLRKLNDEVNYVVEDPRGFRVGITAAELADIMAASGGCMDDYVFKTELAYIWREPGRQPTLIPASSDVWKRSWEESRKEESAAAARKFLKWKQLRPGQIYTIERKRPSAAIPYAADRALLLGESAVFSQHMHSTALRLGRYPTPEEFATAKQRALWSRWSSDMTRCRLRSREFSKPKALVFSPASGLKNSMAPKFFTEAATGRLFPEDVQRPRVENEIPKISSMAGSMWFQAIDLSKGIGWKVLRDPAMLKKMVMAAYAYSSIDTYAAWSTAMDKETWLGCKDMLLETWPAVPAGFTSKCNAYPGKCLTQMQTNFGVGGLCLDKATSSNPEYILHLKTTRAEGSFNARLVAVAGNLDDLFSEACDILQPQIPTLKLMDGSDVPDEEAAWLSSEALEACGKAKFDWMDQP